MPGETWEEFTDKLQRVAANGSSALMGFLIGRGNRLGTVEEFGIEGAPVDISAEELELMKKNVEIKIVDGDEVGSMPF